MRHLCESLVQEGGKAQSCQRESPVSNLDFLLVVVLIDLKAVCAMSPLSQAPCKLHGCHPHSVEPNCVTTIPFPPSASPIAWNG